MKTNSKTIRLWLSATALLLVALYILNWYPKYYAEDEVFIIPEGYSGPVSIYYDELNGAPKEYMEGNRVYRIPANGVLHTQFTFDAGWRSPPEFFLLTRAGKTLPMEAWNTTQAEPDKIVVSSKSMRRKNNVPYYSFFLVGKASQIDSLHRLDEQIHF